MATAPALIEATIRHQVMLEQLKTGEVEKIAKYLREIDKLLRDRLTRDDLTGWGRDRLEKMLSEVDGQILAIYSRYSRQLNADLVDIAEYEAAFESRSLNALMTDFAVAVPTLPALRAAIKARPLQVSGAGGGKLLDSFIEDWTSTERSRVINAVRLGFTQGLTNFQIIQSLRGTKAANYSDGILAISSRNADAIVRTAVQHVSNVARFETWSANSDVVTGYRWVSTLDSKTSTTCRSLDSREFKMGHGPMPPAHIRCRSTTVAMLDESFDFLKEGATRSSKDGYVDASETYYSWLEKQSSKFQDAAIGPTRGKLFREGGLSAQRFSELQLDRRFKPLSLDQLRSIEPLMFERAGV